jgi:hypothetical protein
MAEKNRPAHEVKVGRIRVAVWSNQTEDSDVWFNVTIRRLYKAEGGWRDADSFRRDDLPIVQKAVEMAYDWIWKRQSALSETDEEER